MCGAAILMLFMVTSSAIGQDWSTIPKWTDVGIRGHAGFTNLDFRLEFLMDNYDIISLEKCLYEDHNDHRTEEYFQYLTSKMRELRPQSKSKILYYWSVDTSFACYKALDDLLERPDLWLKDDLGYPVILGGHKQPHYDFRVEDARNLWIQGGLDPVIETRGEANGVFLDGTSLKKLQNCHVKTCGEDGASCCVFSAEAEEAYNQGMAMAVSKLRDQIHDLDRDNIVVGNGLQNYDFNAGDGNPTYDFYVDKLDGFCMEHVMAFEGALHNAKEPPFINIPALENSIHLRNLLVKRGKILLARSYPGPVGQPISPIDGISSPHLPAHYPYPQPQNNLQVQQSLKDLYEFPVAVHLCAFADPGVYLAYSLWYDIRQSVPCPEDPHQCQFPQHFQEFLQMDPGSPLEQPQWEGRLCSRRFANFGVSVDLEDENSVIWIPQYGRNTTGSRTDHSHNFM